MLTPIFPRPITSTELSRVGLEQQIELSLAARVEPERELPAVDQQLLAATAQLMASAGVQLSMQLVQGGMVLPMVEVFVTGGHIITAAYGRDGVWFREALDPVDVKQVLMQPFVMLPMSGTEDDASLEQPGTPEEVFAALKDGKAPEGLEPMTAAIMLHAVMAQRALHCTFRCGEKTEAAYSIEGRGCVHTLFAENGKTQLTTGSPLALIRKLNMQVITAYRDSLKTMQA